ncbi:MAG: 16S rRNA (uracil(1498)-N(3))-methyltransferase [Methyloceanibacter sp.]
MRSKLQRLFVNAPLRARAEVELAVPQAHYLLNVLRLKGGNKLLVFNGKDGEWQAELKTVGRKGTGLVLGAQTRAQPEGPDLHYLFAPLKRARLDYMAQKATELGASHLRPVITGRTVAERINTERLLANAIEAAEQCGILHVPEVQDPAKLSHVLDAWDHKRLLIFADEQAEPTPPLAALGSAAKRAARPLAVLVGPEGGFDVEERALLLTKPFVLPISLGPRVMRADTAAIAALALVNAALGDWR